jgi:Outer membrane protein beta-barrel domain
MKKLVNLSLVILSLIVFSITSNFAQVAPENALKIEAVSSGLALVGTNSSDTQAGPYFGGTVSYGIGKGVTIFAESGYGWTNYSAVDKLKLVQIPVVAGVTYNFGQLFDSELIQPYAGISGGMQNYQLQLDGNTVNNSGYDQKSTSFAAEGILGVNFQINPEFAINVRGKYTHGFSKDGDPGLDSQEFNSVSFGGGISYAFSVLR